MNIVDRIKRSVANRNADVFVRADFMPFGSQAQVGRALNELQSEGVLVKLGVGVYAKAKPSVLSGKPIPIKPLEVLAPEALKKLGVQVGESRQTREYNSGNSTQIPTGVVFSVGKQRIQRKLGFNGKLVEYERA
ncbi:hypothetical protein EC845_3806 [Comamonas sp. BIGb0124]|jgi:hypothetical protein|uniref:DUF6088 family protein n=1 Tax=Comamonas sp. BIGb0124 TaxID=2485130 RepID=UPI000F4842DF|nr:DUF6088 family protein [Comamonas sp. BIGb0124]ROR18001.1 hypothetical protein EC845_3806 [Comamonas sp. BIGb0124]